MHTLRWIWFTCRQAIKLWINLWALINYTGVTCPISDGEISPPVSVWPITNGGFSLPVSVFTSARRFSVERSSVWLVSSGFCLELCLCLSCDEEGTRSNLYTNNTYIVEFWTGTLKIVTGTELAELMQVRGFPCRCSVYNCRLKLLV